LVRERDSSNLPRGTYGPAESVAAGKGPNGKIIVTEPRYNMLLKGNRPGPGVLEAGVNDLVRKVTKKEDGSFFIPSADDYLAALDRLYEGAGTRLNPTLAEAIREYIDLNKGVLPNDVAGGFPGTHAEIQAVNDLLNRDVSPSDISVGTIKSTGTAPEFPACANCGGILDGLGVGEVVTDLPG
jgi:hypothetical protein